MKDQFITDKYNFSKKAILVAQEWLTYVTHYMLKTAVSRLHIGHEVSAKNMVWAITHLERDKFKRCITIAVSIGKWEKKYR